MKEQKGLKILFVSAEVDPFAKTGGLADVALALPQELIAMGHDVRIVMPRYKTIKNEMHYVADFPVMMDWRKETCVLRGLDYPYQLKGKNYSVKVYFLDNYHLYDRDGIYCYFDDADRFTFMCRAALEMLPNIDFKPDIIHCNDWHTGPITMLLKEQYKDKPFYNHISTIFTVHNLEYQGNFSKDVLRLFGLGEEVFVPEKVELYGQFSFMKSGLVYADVINTVSENYAKEIQTPQYGEKLEGLLQRRTNDLFGIVNGISYEIFNPETDKRIVKNFSHKNLEDKYVNKKALQKEMGLPQKANIPLVGLISRLTGQKGLNLIMDQIENMMKLDMQFVLLGAGDPYYENGFTDLAKIYPDKIGVYVGFNAALAQRIYAGSDMFLMPSRFEPCGLGQLFSLRYATIPIVRSTGGLADTVKDYTNNPKDGNGFAFDQFSSYEMMDAITRAVTLYKSSQEEWKNLVKKTFTLDYSWNKPAQRYLSLYQKAMENKVKATC